MDLFEFGYFALICALLAYGAPMLETSLHRILLGLTTGVIAAVALPFVRNLFF
ncbi:MAG: hypothetical protein GXP03_01490 [Alphaproteobacteria bacterium]|nr:hypothetical protein [Alphaproteobacteria bacterium]